MQKEIIENVKLSHITPYERNARKNDHAVDEVLKSIQRTGYRTPIIVDENNVILAGHTRYKAIKKLGWSEIPFVVKYLDLTEHQKQEYRIRDNKAGEIAEWDFEILEADFSVEELVDFGFDLKEKSENEEIEKEEPRTKFGDKRDTLPLNELLNEYDKILVNFSGGKDSICTLIEILKHVPKSKVTVVFVKIEFDYPDLEDYVKYILEKYFYGVEFISLYNSDSIKKIYDYGFPSRLNRWCNSGMKVKPINDLHKKLKNEGVNFITCIGTRSAESKTRERMLGKGIWGLTDYVFPIFNYSDDDVINTIDENNIPAHIYYKYFNRLSCYVCPNHTKKHYATLKKYIPDLWFNALKHITDGFNSDKYRSGMFGKEMLDIIVNHGETIIEPIFKFKKYYDMKNRVEINEP